MNNLKRVLSVALTGTMLAGMMTIGAGATNAEDFTDHSEITHTEAVSIATALKIIDGNDDGSFNPDGNVTRGQMAKMITRAMYGGEDPILGVKATPSFTDIKGRWDETYIEYCASAGIINGRGDGTFDPDGNVTGTEAAKMLLVALGYDATVYEFTGIDWAINTNRIANTIDAKLYDGLKNIDPNAAINRDDVAQMVYNALNAKTKDMVPTTSTNGTVEYTFVNGDTLLYAKYGALRVEGVVTKNEFVDNSDSVAGKTTLSITNGDEIATLMGSNFSSNTFEVSTGKDEFGKAVVIYVKPSAASPKNAAKATVICDVIVDDSNVVVTRTKALSGSAKTVESWVKDNGMEISTGAANEPAATVFFKNYGTTDAPSATSTNTAGNEFIAIDNNSDGYVDYVLENTYAFGKVSKYSTKGDGAVTVVTAESAARDLVPANAALSEIVAYDDISVDDYVNVTKVSDTYYITPAEAVVGELEAFKTGSSVTVEGTTYNFSGRSEHADLDKPGDIAANSVLGEEVTLYLDAFGYFVGGTTEAATDYLFVANASWNNVATSLTSGTLDVFVYTEDGSAASYAVNKITTTTSGVTSSVKPASGSEQTVLGKVYKYSETSDGKLNLTTVTNTFGTASKAVEYKKALSTLTIDNAVDSYITNDTIVFLVTLDSNDSGDALPTIDKVNVYTGKTAPSMSFTAAATPVVNSNKFYSGVATIDTDNDGKNEAVVFVHNETDANGDWIYLINYVKTSLDGAVWNAIVDGEFVQITTNDKSDADLAAGAYEYELDGELYAIGNGYGSVATDFVKLIDDKSVILNNGNEYKVGDDTITAIIDDDDTVTSSPVKEKDYVVVVYDNNTDRNAKGIFVLSEADGTDTSILAVDSSVTGKGTDAAPYVVPSGSSVDDIKDLFTTQQDVEVLVLASDPDGAKISELDDEADSVNDGDTVYLVVIADGAAASSTDYDVYVIEVAAAEVDSGDDTQTPEGGDDTQTPEGGDDTQTPEGGDGTQTPEGGDDTQTPEGGDDTQTPESGD